MVRNITKEALRALARMVVTCHPLGGEIKQHDTYLIFRSREGKNINFNEYLKGALGRDEMYRRLQSLSKEMRKEDIDLEVVFSYFSSYSHMEKVAMDIRSYEETVPEGTIAKLLFTHMFLPGTVASIEDETFSVLYTNDGKSVMIRKLVAFKKDRREIQVGQSVLTHLSAIVFLDRGWGEKILPLPLKSDKFNILLERFDGKEIVQEELSLQTRKIMDIYGL